ncbi:MAG TPA: AtpZ/AtpI family protein [Capsulimonadaceae bacterium]|jgi:F0F1-type ATP synthase assembly protein I
MRPDNDEPAGHNEEDAESVPVVPRSPELPPPPEVHYTRPEMKASKISSSARLTGEAGPTKIDAGAIGRMGAGLSAGLTFVGSVLVGLIIGYFVEQEWPRVAPWGMVISTLVGVAAGFLTLYRILTALDGTNKSQ